MEDLQSMCFLPCFLPFALTLGMWQSRRCGLPHELDSYTALL